ncbi:MAG: DUF5610 domain-containing protein [Planctomycetota bacterium]|jgi:hypothetical protein
MNTEMLPSQAKAHGIYQTMPGLQHRKVFPAGPNIESCPLCSQKAQEGADPLIQTLIPKSQAEDGAFAPLEGLMDAFDLSPFAEGSLTYAKAQFQVNYQSIRAIAGENGMVYEEMNFSMSASFEFLQAASGEAPQDVSQMEGETLIDRLQELFSPEKTAQRILDFALSWYNPQGEDTVDARNAFRQEIGGAVQKGFDEAAAILGPVDDSIQEGIDRTHELVFGGLDDFVQNGLSSDHGERSQSIREYAEAWQRSVQIEISTVQVQVYKSNGEVPSQAPPQHLPFEAVA